MTTLIPSNFYFDESETNVKLKGLHNPLCSWNGFAMPWISEQSIADFIKIINADEGLRFYLTNDKDLVVMDRCEDENGVDCSDVSIIKTIDVDGEKFYDLGWFGFCLHSQSIADYEESLHQDARDLMDAIDLIHKWDSKSSLDEYLFNHFDDLSQVEINAIKTLLDKFDNL